jgi:hypothetical protein
MWMRKLISNTGGWLSTNFATDDLTDFVPLIILRDPIQRWVSNCPARGKILTTSKDPQDLDRLFDNLESWLYDEHSAKQTDFIAGLDLSRAVYFYCDKDLSRNVEYFLRAQGINFTAPAPVNEQETDEITKQSAKIWQELLSRSKYHNRFREIFAADYKLIESVKFYKHDN